MSRRSRKEFPGASPYKDRHGRRRWRFRANGLSRELGRDYGSPEFVRRYEAAQRDAEAGVRGMGAIRTRPRSFDDLIARYYRSSEYLVLADSSKATYRNMLERFREQYGALRADTVQRRHIKEILDRKIDTPEAANNLRDRLNALMNLAIDLEWRKDNPMLNVKAFPSSSRGFHTWTEVEIERFYSVHEFGTTAYKAMTLMLNTGAAPCDVVKLGPDNIQDGRIQYRRQKTARQSGILVDLPIHPQLQRVLDDLPGDARTFLQTYQGRQRSPRGLGNQMRQWCDAARLPECTAHGLRKAICRRLSEAGATPHEIMAVSGHVTLGEIVRYTKEASRRRLAEDALGKLR